MEFRFGMCPILKIEKKEKDLKEARVFGRQMGKYVMRNTAGRTNSADLRSKFRS